MTILKHKSSEGRSGGFTIIELLLSIAILGILSGTAIMVINPARMNARGRDSQRVADLQKLRTALELYYTDNRVYPSQATLASVATSLSALVPNYYSGQTSADLPSDPRYTGNYNNCAGTFNYQYASNGGTYVLVAKMETTDVDYSTCATVSNCAPAVFSCDTCTLCHAVQNPL